VLKVDKVLLVLLEHKDIKEFKVLQDLVVVLDHKVFRVHKDIKEYRVLKDIKVFREHQVF
jgi:hypothetical protein